MPRNVKTKKTVNIVQLKIDYITLGEHNFQKLKDEGWMYGMEEKDEN
jgi:hypothetical protein